MIDQCFNKAFGCEAFCDFAGFATIPWERWGKRARVSCGNIRSRNLSVNAQVYAAGGLTYRSCRESPGQRAPSVNLGSGGWRSRFARFKPRGPRSVVFQSSLARLRLGEAKREFLRETTVSQPHSVFHYPSSRPSRRLIRSESAFASHYKAPTADFTSNTAA